MPGGEAPSSSSSYAIPTKEEASSIWVGRWWSLSCVTSASSLPRCSTLLVTASWKLSFRRDARDFFLHATLSARGSTERHPSGPTHSTASSNHSCGRGDGGGDDSVPKARDEKESGSPSVCIRKEETAEVDPDVEGERHAGHRFPHHAGIPLVVWHTTCRKNVPREAGAKNDGATSYNT